MEQILYQSFTPRAEEPRRDEILIGIWTLLVRGRSLKCCQSRMSLYGRRTKIQDEARQKQLTIGASVEEQSLAYGKILNKQRKKVLVFKTNIVHFTHVKVWQKLRSWVLKTKVILHRHSFTNIASSVGRTIFQWNDGSAGGWFRAVALRACSMSSWKAF